MPKNLTLVFCLVFCLSLHFSYAQDTHKTKLTNFVPGEVILKVKPEAKGKMRNNKPMLPGLETTMAKLGIREIRQMYPSHQPDSKRAAEGEKLVDLSTLYSLKFDPQIAVENVLNELKNDPDIEFVEPRFIYEAFYVPNDPNNLLQANGFTYMNAYLAYDSVTGAHDVVCGIVDVGYRFGETDLDPNLVVNSGEIPGNSIDDDANGYIDDYYGWDMADDDGIVNYPTNWITHGHDVALFYGSVTDNAFKRPGVSFNCGFRQIKTAPNANPAAITHGYEGIIWAADHGCHIINCSWGGSGYSLFGEMAVDYAALNKKCAVVVAAGNTGTDIAFYPAAYRNALSVTSCNGSGVAANSFHYTVDVSSLNGNFTSFAAPVTSAAVALTYRRFNIQRGDPTFTPFQAAQRVRVTTQNHYPVNNPIKQDKLGTGAIDMFQAIKIATPKPSVRIQNQILNIIGDGDNEIESGETVQLPCDFINWLDPTANLQLNITADAVCAPYVTILTPNFIQGVVSKLGTFSQLISFSVSPTAPPDLAIGIKVSYTDAANSYSDFEYILLSANTNSLNITNNKLDLSVSGLGNFGYKNSPENTIGVGVNYDGGHNAIFEGGFLIGRSTTQLSNNIRLSNGAQDMDFSTPLRISPNPSPQGSDFEANAYFADTAATSPLGVKIKHNAYNYTNSPDADYVIMEYLITNSTASPLTNMYAALFADWDVHGDPLDPVAYSKNRCDFDASKKWAYAHQNGFNEYFAIALLTDDAFTSLAYRGSTVTGSSFSDANKFNAISNIPTPATAAITTNDDIMQFVGAGPFTIAAGATYRLAFAIIGGNDLNTMDLVRQHAVKNYFGQIVGRVPANTPAQTIVTGDMEEGDALGWTHYYKSGAANQLLFSIQKDNALAVTPSGVEVGYGGSPYYAQITAPYVQNPSGWYMMTRYWEVSPTVQPASAVAVRMYFTPADFNALKIPCATLSNLQELEFIKFASGSGINPNPLLGQVGATSNDLVLISNSIDSVGGNYYAEFLVSSFSGGGGGASGDGSALPVEDWNFQVSATDSQTALLKWQTSREAHNAYYEVQKSADGSYFEAVGQIPAGNQPNQTQHYSFEDSKPYNGANFYRLQQFDLNGGSSFSEVRSLWLSLDEVVEVYPNPTEGLLHVKTNSTQTLDFIFIYDCLGKKIKEVYPDTHSAKLDLDELAAGVYHLHIRTGGRTFQTKLLKRE